ncbi:hypothetical protein [Anaerotruncus colihominis]|uniref:hypothetical protein n=1 Tax=Anaerotruncus colihominis TaxID=169435 RepID=UPI003515E118
MARKEMTMLSSSPQELVLNPKDNSSGFYCYIGPSITGVIQHGTIWRGSRTAALAAAAPAIEKYPLVKTLIVSGDALPEARLKIKRPGNALYVNYRKIAGLR